MKTGLLLIALAAILLAGCESPTRTTKDVSETVDPKTGNLIAFWKIYKDREEPVLVTERFAVWIAFREKQFYLYDNLTKQTFKTNDLEAYLKRLDELPRGIAIQCFDTCTASRMFGPDMTAEESQLSRVEKVLKDGNRSWAICPFRGDDRWIICTCESQGMRFP